MTTATLTPVGEDARTWLANKIAIVDPRLGATIMRHYRLFAAITRTGLDPQRLSSWDVGGLNVPLKDTILILADTIINKMRNDDILVMPDTAYPAQDDAMFSFITIENIKMPGYIINRRDISTDSIFYLLSICLTFPRFGIVVDRTLTNKGTMLFSEAYDGEGFIVAFG